MVNLPVNFEVPPDIAAKLARGVLVRYGGVVRDLNGQIVLHLKEAGLRQGDEATKQAVDLAKRLSRRIDLTDPRLIAGALVISAVITVGGVLYFSTRKPKPPANPKSPEIPEWVTDYNGSLTAYLRAIQDSTLNVEVIDRLVAALDVLERQENDDTVVLDLSKSEAAQLGSVVVRYTKELAAANSVELDDLQQPDSDDASILDLRRYLEIQKQIFADVA